MTRLFRLLFGLRAPPPRFRARHRGGRRPPARHDALDQQEQAGGYVAELIREAASQRREAVERQSEVEPCSRPLPSCAPIDKVSLAFTILLAAVVLGETISWQVGVGAALMVAGALFTLVG
jgi:hypothetical protein